MKSISKFFTRLVPVTAAEWDNFDAFVLPLIVGGAFLYWWFL